LPYIVNILKHSITGELKEIRSLIDKEKLSYSAILDCRGLAVKAYDSEKEMINTREWNPVAFAIFFK
jgi:hypothetical protein